MSGTTGTARLVAGLGWRLAFVVAAAGAFWAAWTIEPTASTPRAPTPVPAAAAGQDAAEPAAVEGAYADIAARPLFYPSRKPWMPPPPPPAPVAAPAAPPPLTNYALVGVVVSGDTRTALIRPPGARTTIMLAEGQDLAGWKLQEITRTRLRFAAGDASYEMNFPKPSESGR
jgi:hypothetical protein